MSGRRPGQRWSGSRRAWPSKPAVIRPWSSSSRCRSWSRQLFVALCRRYGLRPYRYPRQKRTTVMLRAPNGFLDTVLWPEFLELERALRAHLQGVTTRIIHDAVHADTSDAEEVNPALPGL